MSATITWKSGDDVLTYGATDLVGFYGPAGHNDPISVGDWNDSTRLRTAAGEDGGALPNCKYLTDSTVDIGGGSQDVNTVLDHECTLHIQVTMDSEVETSNSYFDSYGTTTSEAPGDGNLSVKAFERGDAAWADIGPPATARLALEDQAAATTHDYYIAVSVSPTGYGALTFTLRISTNYT